MAAGLTMAVVSITPVLEQLLYSIALSALTRRQTPAEVWRILGPARLAWPTVFSSVTINHQVAAAPELAILAARLMSRVVALLRMTFPRRAARSITQAHLISVVVAFRTPLLLSGGELFLMPTAM